MAQKDREALFKIVRAVAKLQEPPPTTFAPQTGAIQQPYQPTVNVPPLPLGIYGQSKR